MIKIDIVSGFLGAGKTTFIKKMIDEVYKGEKIALIENEFGEIGIDGGFLKDAGINITEMNSGCICCSLVGDFGDNLKEVIATYQPERIIIEPSGVGKLSDVMKSVTDIEKEQDVKLQGLVTIVNAKKASKQMKAFGEFFNNQIAYATTIVLSRTQDIEPSKLEACVEQIREWNEKAAIITTPWDSIAGEQIQAVIVGQNSLETDLMEEAHHHQEECSHEHHHGEECHHEHHHEEECHHDHHHHEHGEECTCGCHDHHHEEGHHHADEVFTSWGKETPHKFTREGLLHALKVLSNEETHGTILRAKGMVEGEDGTWMYFDMVPGEYEIREGNPEYTGRLCVIGTDLEESKLEALFGLS